MQDKIKQIQNKLAKIEEGLTIEEQIIAKTELAKLIEDINGDLEEYLRKMKEIEEKQNNS